MTKLSFVNIKYTPWLKERIILPHAGNFSLNITCARNLIILPVVKDAAAVLWQCSCKCVLWTVHVRITLLLFTVIKHNRYKARKLVYNWELEIRTWIIHFYDWSMHVDKNSYLIIRRQWTQIIMCLYQAKIVSCLHWKWSDFNT